jgi:hypothetical protein
VENPPRKPPTGERPASRVTDYDDLYDDPAPTVGAQVGTPPRRMPVDPPQEHRREFLADMPGRPEYLTRDPDAIMRHIAMQQDAEYGGADNGGKKGPPGPPRDERREREAPRPPRQREPPRRPNTGPRDGRNGTPNAGGPPGGPPPPGPPDNDGSDSSSSEEDPSESVLNSEQNYVHQQMLARDRADRQYLRGYTPGNARYMDAMQDRYTRRIREMVGDPLGQVGPELKAMNPPKPSKYGGQDDLEKFDDWLSQLLKYFRTFKVAGPDRDADRVLYTGLYLEGIAAQWYDQEIESPDRRVRHWDFESLIIELFKRFVHEASAQHAADQFDRTRYDHEKGVLAFYNDLKRRAYRMIEPPDDYSFRRKFLRGLPHTLIKAIYEARGISAEHSTIEEVLEEVRRMETAQKAIAQHLKIGQGSSGRSPQKGPNSITSKAPDEGSTYERRGKPPFYKRGDTLYRRRERISRFNKGGGDVPRRETRGNEPAKDKATRKFMPGIICYRCNKEGHMVPDCDQPPDPGHDSSKRRLFAVDVQTNEDSQQGGAGTTTSEQLVHQDDPVSAASCTDAPKGRDASDDSLFDSYEEISDVDDDDEPVAYFGAMHEVEESPSDNDYVVHCAMAHVVDDHDMPGLNDPGSDDASVPSEDEPMTEDEDSDDGGFPYDGEARDSTGLPSRNWQWHPQYGVMHRGPCTECGLRAHHVERGMREATASINHAMDDPLRRAHAEYQRGVDLGRRTRIAYIEGSSDAELPTAIRLMAELVRETEEQRQAAQTALAEARDYATRGMTERVLRRIDEASDRLIELERVTQCVQVNADTVKVSSPGGTLWVNEDGTVQTRLYREEGNGVRRPRTWDDPIVIPELSYDEEPYLENAISGEEERSSGGTASRSPRWRWSRLFGAVHEGDSCSECHARAIHITRHILDQSGNLEPVLRYPSQLARRSYDEGWDEGNRALPQANMDNHRRMISALRILAGHVVHYRGIIREVSEDSAVRASNLLRHGGTPTEIQHCINVFRRFDGMELESEPHDVLIFPDDLRVMTPIGPVTISRLGLPINPSIRLAAMYLARVKELPTQEERAFKYTMRTKNQPDAVDGRPQVPASLRNCATLHIRINGCKALTMIDTGSTGNFVSPAFAAVTKLETFPLHQQLTLQLGCIGSRSKISHGANAPAVIGDLTTHVYVDVANIDRYDCILGIPFLREYGAVLDFSANRMTLNGGHGVELDGYDNTNRTADGRTHMKRPFTRSE